MKLRIAAIVPLLFLLISCGVPDDSVLQLQQQNAALQAKNDSLVQVIAHLEQSPREVLVSAKQLLSVGEKDSAVHMLKNLSRRSLTSRDAAEVARLLKVPKGKVEKSKKLSLAAAEIGVKDEDASLYDAGDKEPRLQSDDKVEHNWTVEASKPVVKRPVKEKTYSVRVGAICRDGTRSSATGRGACSHHGGVSEWVME